MTPEELAAVMEATWPAARVWRQGPFLCRDGAGVGGRDVDGLGGPVQQVVEVRHGFLLRGGRSGR